MPRLIPRQLRHATPRSIALGVLLAVALPIATTACASDGRELAEGRAWQTTTTRPVPPTSAPASSPGLNGLTLTSPDFAAGELAPLDATCAGTNQPPIVEWAGQAENTAEWAVSLSDQTDPAEPLLLWLVVGIDPSVTMLDATTTASAVETLNDYGQLGYGNPCIDTLATGLLDLQFRVYSLTAPSDIEPGAPGNESWDRVSAGSNDSATLLMKVEAAA